MNNKTIALLLFILAVVMVVLGWVIKGLPPVVTGIGFALIGDYIYKEPSK